MSEIDEIPKPESEKFSLIEIKKISIPHLYCVTPRHVAHASDKFGGILNEVAIRDAEKHGAKCDICKGKYKYDDHTTAKTLIIEVSQNKDLNAIEGLVEYLIKIKPVCEKLKIEGFAFPTFTGGK